jgi:hypothetical protein
MRAVFNGSLIEMRLVDGRGIPLAPYSTVGTQTDIIAPVMAVGTCVNSATSPMATVDTVDIEEAIFNTVMDDVANWQPNISGPLDTGVLEEPQTEETVATAAEEVPTCLTKSTVPTVIDLSDNEQPVVTAPCEPVNIRQKFVNSHLPLHHSRSAVSLVRWNLRCCRKKVWRKETAANASVPSNARFPVRDKARYASGLPQHRSAMQRRKVMKTFSHHRDAQRRTRLRRNGRAVWRTMMKHQLQALRIFSKVCHTLLPIRWKVVSGRQTSLLTSVYACTRRSCS